MAEIDSQFFFLIALIAFFLYLKKETVKLLAITGLFIGLAFVTNGDRFAFLTPILIEIYRQFRKFFLSANKKMDSVKKLFFLLIFFILPIIFAEIPYYIAFLISRGVGKLITVPTYIEQFIWAHRSLSNFGFGLDSIYSLITYPYLMIIFGGYTLLILLVTGIISSLKEKVYLFQILAIIVILTISFQTLFSLQAARGITPILPLIAILASIGLSKIYNLSAKSWSLLYPFIIIVFLLELTVNSLAFIKYKTPYPNLSAFLSLNNASVILTTNDNIIKAYYPNQKYIIYQNTLAQNKLPSPSPDYIVTNVQKYTNTTQARNLSKSLDFYTQQIEKRCQLKYSLSDFPNKKFIEMFAFEHNVSTKKTIEFINNFSLPEDAKIKVYSYPECMKVLNEKI